MMIGKRIGMGLATLMLVALYTPGLSGQDDTFEWNGRVSRGGTLHVKGIVGDIRATLASGDQIEVVARKRGDRDDFEEVAVEVAEADGDVYICAVYGSWKHGEGACDPDYENNDRRWRHRNVDMDVEVDYEVRVPAGVELDLATVSGRVRAEGLQSNVSGSSVDGDVFIETSGQGWASTVSGDIEVDMGEVGTGDMDFSTVSGDITLWLPDDFSADVDFSSLSGDLDTDFDLRIERQRTNRWVRSTAIQGTIGNGGRELTVNTVSGDVELRRRGR